MLLFYQGTVFSLAKEDDIFILSDIEQFYSLDLREIFWKFSEFKKYKD